MECLILVGGLGERLKKAVPNLPKPLAPISNKPFLNYLMEYWKYQGITHFILAAGYKSELIQNYVDKFYSNDFVDISIEKAPLGTGGGLLKASKFLNSQK